MHIGLEELRAGFDLRDAEVWHRLCQSADLEWISPSLRRFCDDMQIDVFLTRFSPTMSHSFCTLTVNALHGLPVDSRNTRPYWCVTFVRRLTSFSILSIFVHCDGEISWTVWGEKQEKDQRRYTDEVAMRELIVSLLMTVLDRRTRPNSM